jgi:protein-disulfide isomerase
MKNRRVVLILALFLIPLFFSTGCADKKKVEELEKTQKEILDKLSAIEENQGKLLRREQAVRQPAEDANKIQEIPIGNSPVKGNMNAPVAIVEFSDYQCPYCSKLQPTLNDVLKAYPKDVKLVFKNFPLPFHSEARNASKAALAAGEQDKFWQMHDIIFENFNELSSEKFKQFAKKIGLDVNKFTADYNSNKYDFQIQQDINLGTAVGVRGTPTLFVNGQMISNRSFAGFKEAIDNALKK